MHCVASVITGVSTVVITVVITDVTVVITDVTVVITGITECATAGDWGVPDSAARGQRGAERQYADAGGDGHAAA